MLSLWETDNFEIESQRLRQIKNLLTILFVSQGTPMILMGDEWARTRSGNNNGYAQDNELNWVKWPDIGDPKHDFADFLASLIRIRRERSLLRRRAFLHSDPLEGYDGIANVHWCGPDGKAIPPEKWRSDDGRISLMLNGIGQRSLLMLLNPGEATDFTVPPIGPANGLPETWRVLVDSATGEIEPARPPVARAQMLSMAARSLVLLEATEAPLLERVGNGEVRVVLGTEEMQCLIAPAARDLLPCTEGKRRSQNTSVPNRPS